ncbi:glycosyltransferase family 2 protein [Bizionia hallyeonensis]|uniref:Glycosyltransferase family 2 protein n=1 Tax=Bizionia hallyeonensis TaxID=1123757 RepID=A0ABW0C6X6_9FLAO
MQLEQPLISIIIPTFNRAHLIGATLDSVLAQTYLNWECLVIDDGSTDKTLEVLTVYMNRDKRFQYHPRPESHLKGGNGARNFGFEKSKGDYIQWFDSDDLMDPNLLDMQLGNILTNQAGFSLCLFDLIDENGDALKKGIAHSLQDGFYYDYIIRRLPANLPTILFRKSVLVGHPLNEHLLKSQEYEFLQRFFRMNHDQGVMLNKALVQVIRHSESITEQHTPGKVASALDALLITNSELPSTKPTYIRSALAILYLRTLYLAFTSRMTDVFYKYLLKMRYFHFYKSLLSIVYLSLMYILVKVMPIGNWHYKNIYNLYR